MNILILAAGRVQSSINSEDTYPACLTELNGVSALESIVGNLANIEGAKYTFALHAEDISSFHLDNIAKLLVPDARIKVVPKSTMGSACTALLVACELEADHPLLVISANELVREDIAAVLHHFSDRCLDAGTLVFRSVHPRYSYVRLNKDGLVIEAAQQKPISQVATSGVFWYARASDFIEAAKDAIRKGAATNGCFYLAPVLNELILTHKKIGVKEIEKIDYIPLKTANQIQQYEQGQQ